MKKKDRIKELEAEVKKLQDKLGFKRISDLPKASDINGDDEIEHTVNFEKGTVSSLFSTKRTPSLKDSEYSKEHTAMFGGFCIRNFNSDKIEVKGKTFKEACDEVDKIARQRRILKLNLKRTISISLDKFIRETSIDSVYLNIECEVKPLVYKSEISKDSKKIGTSINITIK